jgi:putative nucleotidyltransferase with HDIG domain
MATIALNHTLSLNCKTGEALQMALKHRDEYTQNHCERVTSIAIKTGEHFEFDGELLYQLETAAIFHDIGKIGIPDDILLNPGKLTSGQYEQMKTHAVAGASIAEKLDIPSADKIAEIILHHHEHYDGSGYPHGLKGEEISLSSRIISVIDVFDALSSHRVYRKPISSEKALTIMAEEMSNEFDPLVLKAVSQIVKNHSF